MARLELSVEKFAELWASLTPEERYWARKIREKQAQLREIEFYKVHKRSPKGHVRAKLEREI